MTHDRMKRDVKRIKRGAEINWDNLSFNNAAGRHELRARFVYRIFRDSVEADRKLLDKGALPDPSEPDYADGLMKQFDELRSDLGETELKRWRQDQATLENAHRRAYGHVEKLARCSAFGSTPEEMLQHMATQFCAVVHDHLPNDEAREFRQDVRDTVQRAGFGPIKLHPPEDDAVGIFFIPEGIPGMKDYASWFLYLCLDFPDYDPESVINLREEGE